MDTSQSFLTFVRKNITSIKYFGLVLVFFSTILAIRTYINYLAIQETIANTNREIFLQNQQIAYTENFLLRYYDSEYKEYFSHHKNSILQRGEKIIKIKIIDPTEKKKEMTKREAIQSISGLQKITPAQSRNQFIKEKREKI
ncbi:MAG: hypothetical protein CR971_01040 [candidate division SR1 bacterium]|nr:MAG: hypothetical protein CR971_01040 [candidate division SR1 bacterium]